MQVSERHEICTREHDIKKQHQGELRDKKHKIKPTLGDCKGIQWVSKTHTHKYVIAELEWKKGSRKHENNLKVRG